MLCNHFRAHVQLIYRLFQTHYIYILNKRDILNERERERKREKERDRKRDREKKILNERDRGREISSVSH